MAQGLRKHHHVMYEAEEKKVYDQRNDCIIHYVTYRCYCPNCNFSYTDESVLSIVPAKSKTKALDRYKARHKCKVYSDK